MEGVNEKTQKRNRKEQLGQKKKFRTVRLV